ncbi:MAG TPA: helix-turn-helix domain-containing protein [Pseudonocardiaceae bacterium]|jgi:WD40 repeat protein|nr:helix-turn-helix domain-containing protein [Pseudonocardiaceae bacterium]
MPRAERPLELDGGPLPPFAAQLRELRETAGSPPYRELARRAHYSAGTLSDAAGGRRLPSLSVTLAYVRACGGAAEEWEQRWHAVAAELAVSAAASPDSVDTRNPEEHCPYVGLRAFQPKDSGRFHGREDLTERLVGRVAEQRFLGVFGASGVGKSSLLRAGLVARLRARQAVVLFTPGAHPLEECAIAVAGLTNQPPAALRAELRAEPDSLHQRIRQARHDQRDEQDVVLVVDQFEEIFTLCEDEAERGAFLRALGYASTAPISCTRVVLGVRTDFYTQCAGYPELVDALQDAQLLVGPLDVDGLRAAITQPAADADYTVESALLAQVVADAAGQPGVLPLVSHALVETWRRRRGNALTLRGYQAAGGITHAIAHTAEAVHAGFDDAQQRVAEDLFLRLIAVGEEAEDTKRRVPRSELDSDDPNLAVVLDRLTEARLIVLDGTRVEMTHEALIRCWPRLRGWLDADRAGLRVHRQLTEATDIWESLHRDEGALYRGTRLAVAAEWAPTHDQCLSRRERAFLLASINADTVHRRGTVRRRQLRWVTVVLTVLLVISGGLAVFAQAGRRSADAQRQDAISRQLAADSAAATEPDTAMVLALAAYEQDPTTEARSALLSAQSQYPVTRLTGHTGPVSGVAFNPVTHTMATASEDGTVKLWDPRTDGLLTTIPVGGPTHDVVFSPDGTKLAFAVTLDSAGVTGPIKRVGTTGAVELVDAVRHTVLGLLRVPADEVTQLAFSPDGTTIVAATDNHVVIRWSVTDQTQVAQYATATTSAETVAFSPDGQLLAVGNGDGTVQLFAAETGVPGPVLSGPPGPVEQVDFSSNGRWLASTEPDGTASIWDTKTWRRVSVIGGKSVAAAPAGISSGVSTALRSVVFSPDASTVATVGPNGVQLWDVATGSLRDTLTGLADVTDWPVIAFSPDGRTLVTTDGDDTLLWSLAGTATATMATAATVTATATTMTTAVAYSRNGALVATGAADGTIELRTATGPTPVATIPAPGPVGAVDSVAFSSDGQQVIAGYANGPVVRWRTSTRTALDTLGPANALAVGTVGPDEQILATANGDGTIGLRDLGRRRSAGTIAAGPGAVTAVAFSLDGTTLAGASEGAGHPIRIWDARTRTLTATLRGNPDITGIALSPDGRTLAAACGDGTVKLWDTASASLLASFPLPANASAVAISLDGHTLAAADGSAIHLWDLVGRTDLATLNRPTGTVTGLAFSADSRLLASAGTPDVARFWELDPSQVSGQLCAVVGVVGQTRWAQLLPDQPYEPTCVGRQGG